MISLYRVFWYLLRKQKYTVLYFLMKKLLGPKLLHPCYSRPSLYNRLIKYVISRDVDYFYDPWVFVL
jgi:hypothetical protein